MSNPVHFPLAFQGAISQQMADEAGSNHQQIN
jgi:hypothetical protein